MSHISKITIFKNKKINYPAQKVVFKCITIYSSIKNSLGMVHYEAGPKTLLLRLLFLLNLSVVVAF